MSEATIPGERPGEFCLEFVYEGPEKDQWMIRHSKTGERLCGISSFRLDGLENGLDRLTVTVLLRPKHKLCS